MLDTNYLNLLRKSELIENLSSEETKNKILDIYNNSLKPELDKEANSVGISAIQVGIPLKIFVIRTENNDTIYINPTFTPVYNKGKISKKVSDSEGCLSFPDIFCLVERYKKIYINGFKLIDEQIVKIKPETILTDFEAIVFQHEYDHLEGITFLQKGQRLMISNNKDIKKIFLIEELDDYLIEDEPLTIFKQIEHKINKQDHYAIGIKNCKQD